MSRKFKELDLEVKLAGVFGIIAVIAIIVEMTLSGFTVDSVASGIKDTAGTIVAVLVFLIAIKGLRTKKDVTFVELYNQEMDRMLKKYSPILRRDEIHATAEKNNTRDTMHDNKLKHTERYLLSRHLDGIFGNTTEKALPRFCDIDRDNCREITFYINNETFGFATHSEEDQAQKYITLLLIKGFVEKFVGREYSQNAKYSCVEINKSESKLTVMFNDFLSTKEDAKMLSDIVECVLIGILALENKPINISKEMIEEITKQ